MTRPRGRPRAGLYATCFFLAAACRQKARPWVSQTDGFRHCLLAGV